MLSKIIKNILLGFLGGLGFSLLLILVSVFIDFGAYVFYIAAGLCYVLISGITLLKNRQIKIALFRFAEFMVFGIIIFSLFIRTDLFDTILRLINVTLSGKGAFIPTALLIGTAFVEFAIIIAALLSRKIINKKLDN